MMSAHDHIVRLFVHLAWADREALRSLRESAADLPKPRELMAHVLGAESVWLARIEGRDPEVPVWPELSLDACEELAGRVHAAYAGLATRLDDEGHRRNVRYRNSAGLTFDSTIGDILVHVALHGAYHRGQIAALVRAAGSTPSPTDYIGFVRGTAAATRTAAGD